jgi:hypothetical protein
MLLDIIFVISLRFFIFDFSHFKSIRNKFFQLNNYFITKFLKCPFCQGFWLGLFYNIIKSGGLFLESVFFGFVMAIICLCWNVIFWPLIDSYEEKYK